MNAKRKVLKIKDFYIKSTKGFFKIDKKYIFLRSNPNYGEDNTVEHLCEQNIYVASKWLPERKIYVEDTDGKFYTFSYDCDRGFNDGVIFENVKFNEIDIEDAIFINEEDLEKIHVELTIQSELKNKERYEDIKTECDGIIQDLTFFNINVTSTIDENELKYVFDGEEANIYNIVQEIKDTLYAEDVYDSLSLLYNNYKPKNIVFKVDERAAEQIKKKEKQMELDKQINTI